MRQKDCIHVLGVTGKVAEPSVVVSLLMYTLGETDFAACDMPRTPHVESQYCLPSTLCGNPGATWIIKQELLHCPLLVELCIQLIEGDHYARMVFLIVHML